MSTWDAIDQLRKNKQENFLTTLHLQESFWTWNAKRRKRLKGSEARLDRQKKNTSYIHIASSLREIEGVKINIDIVAVHKFTAIKSISTDSSSNCIFFYLNCNCDFCKGDLFPSLLWPQFFNQHLLRQTEKNHFSTCIAFASSVASSSSAWVIQST